MNILPHADTSISASRFHTASHTAAVHHKPILGLTVPAALRCDGPKLDGVFIYTAAAQLEMKAGLGHFTAGDSSVKYRLKLGTEQTQICHP